jgi:hypothetical protein
MGGVNWGVIIGTGANSSGDYAGLSAQGTISAGTGIPHINAMMVWHILLFTLKICSLLVKW